jgi:glutathione synthase/RimK-type ligase-like ATP-grasp enzyme
MVNVLIPTQPDDMHALYVKLALEKKQHQASLWYTADFPQRQTQTFKLTEAGLAWHFQGVDLNINTMNSFDTVWHRRPQKPVISSVIHADDRLNTTNEMNTFYKNIWHVIEPNAFWVNPVTQTYIANSKLRQLTLAAETGFSIPKTLLSNDPAEIKAFLTEHPEGSVIYKTLCPVVWPDQDENAIRLTYTKTITLAELPSNDMLQNATGIFQQKIPKAFELRITCLGNHAIAAKLHSQQHPKGIMDWRYVPRNELLIEPFELPDDIHEKCKAFMKKLGIVFGCLDFIVTPDGEYYFLEVNEQGQFLWIEDVNPEFKLLDAFTEFLAQGSRDFEWQPSRQSVSIAEFSNQAVRLQKDALSKHINSDKFGLNPGK